MIVEHVSPRSGSGRDGCCLSPSRNIILSASLNGKACSGMKFQSFAPFSLFSTCGLTVYRCTRRCLFEHYLESQLLTCSGGAQVAMLVEIQEGDSPCNVLEESAWI